MTRRRLRKPEQNVVDDAVRRALEAARPDLVSIERVIAEELLPSVPAPLAEHALYEFMNEVGRELFAAAEISLLIADRPATETK